MYYSYLFVPLANEYGSTYGECYIQISKAEESGINPEFTVCSSYTIEKTRQKNATEPRNKVSLLIIPIESRDDRHNEIVLSASKEYNPLLRMRP